MAFEISSGHSLPNFVGIDWGASRQEAIEKMEQREGVILEEGHAGRGNVTFYGGIFAGKDVKLWVLQFHRDRLHTGKIVIDPPARRLAEEFQEINAELERLYGSPVSQSTSNKKLYSFGSDGEVTGSILCQVTEGQIVVTYQNQKLNQEAMSAGQGGGCFVATATLGRSDHPAVVSLKQFRDEVLLQSKTGRVFVEIYYALGPSLAKVIQKSAFLRSISRVFIIRPAVFLARKKISK